MRRILQATLADLINVWRDTRQIVLVAQTAAMYAAILIPFKVGIPLIPGFAELRPANAIPIVASFLFGPVAAWGAGLGNLIGDCFGTLGPASVFGFLGNFLYGFLPYVLWGHLGPLSSGQRLDLRTWNQLFEFSIICIVSSLACAIVIAWGVDWLGLVPFPILATAIFANNLLMSLILVPPLFLFLHPRVTRWGLRYEDIRSNYGIRPQSHAPSTNISSQRTSSIFISSPSVSPPFVSMEQVQFSYSHAQSPALAGLSLHIQQGESLALMGPSGAGKSSFLFTLNGLIPHQISGSWSGSLRVNNQDTRERPVWEQAAQVGLLFQDFEAQLVSTNIKQELLFPLEYLAARTSALTSQEVEDRIKHTLERVGLSGLEQRNPLSLSGGQRQRLAIGTILIQHPALLALDEPMTDLDPEGRNMLITLLSRLQKAGTTLVLSEHDPEVAVHMDKIVILEKGTIVWEGRAVDLYGYPHHQSVIQQHGLLPLPISRIFPHQDLPQYPTSVEEAWQLADDLGYTLRPEKNNEPTNTVDRSHMASSPIILDVQKAYFEYESGKSIVSDIDLTIRQGEFVGIVGRNGSGKSTLAGLLNGLRTPSKGQVLIQGHNTQRLTSGERAAMVGFVFQNPDHQIFAETVEDEVSFGMNNLGYSLEERLQRTTEALEAVGLVERTIRSQDPFSLNKGNRQRVAVASVLATRPDILIFDEPTTGLDAQETTRMMNMLTALNQKGHTIIMITHSLALVGSFAHRCIIMQEGGVFADGTPREIFTQLLDPAIGKRTGLEVPSVTRFSARWGQTLLNVQEVRSALRPL